MQIDIEGAEWEVLDDYFKINKPLPFSEILIEVLSPPITVPSSSLLPSCVSSSILR